MGPTPGEGCRYEWERRGKGRGQRGQRQEGVEKLDELPCDGHQSLSPICPSTRQDVRRHGTASIRGQDASLTFDRSDQRHVHHPHVAARIDSTRHLGHRNDDMHRYLVAEPLASTAYPGLPYALEETRKEKGEWSLKPADLPTYLSCFIVVGGTRTKASKVWAFQRSIETWPGY